MEKLGKTLPPGKIAESWEISAHPVRMGRVSNGIFRGMTLEKLADTHWEEILGSSRTAGSPGKFPLLI
ncbi:MAG: mannose-6-phosphate isomerase, partial [Clostridia bacterium]